MVGTYQPVECAGTYTYRHPKDREDGQPPLTFTVTDLQSIGVKEGDYLALRAEGTFYWHLSGQTGTNLGGVFRDRRGRPLFAARYGQEEKFETAATYFTPKKETDIPEDFLIPVDREVIVRVPKGAVEIAYSVGDSAYWDNRPGPTGFGVRISRPNRSAPTPGGVIAVCKSAKDRSEKPDRSASVFSLTPPPIARRFSQSPFAVEASQDAFPEWRGWYKNTGWCPWKSKYGAVRPGNPRPHGGWDIFSPVGAMLIAPVGPALFTWDPYPNGGGRARFRFRRGRKVYEIYYAHCSEPMWVHGTEIQIGQVAAKSGCGGNAADEQCGSPLRTGGRTDHVHVGLNVIENGARVARDPAELLNWTIREPV